MNIHTYGLRIIPLSDLLNDIKSDLTENLLPNGNSNSANNTRRMIMRGKYSDKISVQYIHTGEIMEYDIKRYVDQYAPTAKDNCISITHTSTLPITAFDQINMVHNYNTYLPLTVEELKLQYKYCYGSDIDELQCSDQVEVNSASGPRMLPLCTLIL
jgi:hypothetical protein